MCPSSVNILSVLVNLNDSEVGTIIIHSITDKGTKLIETKRLDKGHVVGMRRGVTVWTKYDIARTRTL